MLYGTNWVGKPVTISHVLEVVNSLPAYLEGEDRPSFAYTNIASIIKNYCFQTGIQPEPFKREEMCSAHDRYERRFWEQSLDLCLHDAAVTHTYLAARLDNPNHREQQAGIACDIWFWSRQLRKDVAEEQARENTRRNL